MGEQTHVVVVVVVRVLAVPVGVRQGAVVAAGVEAAGAVEQRQAVGEFVVKVVASLGYEGTVAIPARDPAVDAAGARQRGVLENMAVHFCWLVQVSRRVVLWEKNGIL